MRVIWETGGKRTASLTDMAHSTIITRRHGRELSYRQERVRRYKSPGQMDMYAILETGGKQYKVVPGQTIDVECLEANAGDTVELERVLMVAEGDDIRVGRPVLDGASVLATVVEHGRGRKLIVFKYRAKQRYRRKTGHRQGYTRLRIDEIKA